MSFIGLLKLIPHQTGQYVAHACPSPFGRVSILLYVYKSCGLHNKHGHCMVILRIVFQMANLVISLMLVTVTFSIRHTAAQDCRDPFYIPDAAQKQTRLQRAWMILYGKDTSPEQPCETATANCNRRQISFEVYCIIKGPQDVPQNIVIGARTNIGPCDGTYFAHSERNQTFLAFVKRLNITHYEWDELVPNAAAKFPLSDFSLPDISHACGVSTWSPPVNSTHTCPSRPTLDTSLYCPKGCVMLWYFL